MLNNLGDSGSKAFTGQVRNMYVKWEGKGIEKNTEAWSLSNRIIPISININRLFLFLSFLFVETRS